MEKFGKIYREKAEKVLRTNFQGSNSVFIIGYEGINASNLGELRQDLQSVGARLFVSRNALAKRAVGDRELKRLTEFIDGPTGFIFIQDNIAAISKILKTFKKDNDALTVRGGILENRLLEKKDIETLANLPSREVLISMVVSGMKSPINNFVLLLNQLILRFVLVVKAISDTKK